MTTATRTTGVWLEMRRAKPGGGTPVAAGTVSCVPVLRLRLRENAAPFMCYARACSVGGGPLQVDSPAPTPSPSRPRRLQEACPVKMKPDGKLSSGHSRTEAHSLVLQSKIRAHSYLFTVQLGATFQWLTQCGYSPSSSPVWQPACLPLFV